MKILLLGGSGQLGLELDKRARDLNFEFVSPVLSELDISEIDQLRHIAQRASSNLVINCAAYTNVDGAENNPEEAFKVNKLGAANAAQVAKELSARFIHISTDYVFDGLAEAPIAENAPTKPINVYGRSKLEGEQEIERILDGQGLIVRTSSLHGRRGANFVHTMLDLFQKRDSVKVVNDKVMSPTWAGWLAEVLLDLGRMSCSGIVHACGAGQCSWFEFASEILASARPKLGDRLVQVIGCSSAEYPTPAARPAYSVLSCERLTKLLGRKPISWREGLRYHLRELGYD